MPNTNKTKRVVPQRSWPVPIIAQDPSVTDANGVILGEAEVANESCAPGPRGARVHVVDYDASSNRFYRPSKLPIFGGEKELREYAKLLADPAKLAKDRNLHCINAYATVMHVLGRFENALGRRMAWGFGDYGGHQISVVPHAFADANAYYSEENRALMFGYFQAGNRANGAMVYSCLSHDIVAHEASHALLDGLRTRYTDPSSPDQAAFHEAFSDLTALLSVFTMPKVVTALLDPSARKGGTRRRTEKLVVAPKDFDGIWLKESPLVAMAEQFGGALGAMPHRAALRVALLLEPDRNLYRNFDEFGEPHRRAEILVAATMRALITMWKRALWGHLLEPERPIPLDVVVNEGCELAERLLSMVIRAIDYAPVVDISFPDFLTALLTADRELYPRDDKYKARDAFIQHFGAYGISPAGADGNYWQPPEEGLRYDHVHPNVLRQDPNEVFRFLWENRKALNIDEQAYTRVLSVRPCVRKGYDGFYLQETVCEYVQLLRLRASELSRIRLESRTPRGQRERLIRPDGLDDSDEVTLNGGGVLLFDEYGRLKFHVQSHVRSSRQSERLEALAAAGALLTNSGQRRHFAVLHRAGATRWAGPRPSLATRGSAAHRHGSSTENW